MIAAKDRRAEETEPAIDYNAVRQRLSVQPVPHACAGKTTIPREGANHPVTASTIVHEDLPVTATCVKMIVPLVARETNNAKGPLEAEVKDNEALGVVGVVGEEEEDQEATR